MHYSTVVATLITINPANGIPEEIEAFQLLLHAI